MKSFSLCSVIVAASGFLGAGAGCQLQQTHQENVNVANQRWLSTRSAMMMSMGQQQFDTGDLEQAEKTVADAISVDPGNPRLHVLAGRIGLERGQLERAAQRFGTAIELNAKLPEAHYYLGIVKQRWQKYDEALRSYELARDLAPDNPAFVLAISEMLVALDRVDDAIATLADRLVYFDQNAGMRAALARLYALRGDYDRALPLMQEAALLRPEDPQISEPLAALFIEAGRHQEAAGVLEQLLRQPSHRDRLDLKRALAKTYLSLERTGEARTLYRELVRLDPTDADSWLQLGEMAWADGDTSGALTAAQRALDTAPRLFEAHLLIGMVWQKRGRLDDALQAFDRAAACNPQRAEPHILRGMALERAGRTAAAREAYAQASRLQPDNSRVKSLHDRLVAVPTP